MTGSSLRLLVIGYGNTLRRDDGAGVRAAETVEALALPGIEVITRHQLVPELAEPISRAQVVVFVDAAVNAAVAPTGVALRPIEAGQIAEAVSAPNLLGHATSPQSLIAMARGLFGHGPEAWTLAIPVMDMEFGEELSTEAQTGVEEAVRMIRELYASRK